MHATKFYTHLIEEVDNTRGTPLSKYYTKLATNVPKRPFYQYNWVSRITPIQELILSLPRREQPWRILDSGCGVGTESLFYAQLRDDIEVLGIDISRERLATAQARVSIYERKFEQKLNIAFREENIFDVLADERFDIIWVMEALSHIDPAEAYLQDAYESLSPNGRLVISDSHLPNPYMLWRLYKMRGFRSVERKTMILPTGKPISYANERLFTVGRLAKMLRQAGFNRSKSYLNIFFPPLLSSNPALFRIAGHLDKILARLPFIRNLGGIYTIVAHKQQ